MAFGFNLRAQSISGTITDLQTGQPIPFSSIYIKGSTHGVSSNFKGTYRLETAQNNLTLIFQAIGYQKQVLNFVLNGDTIIDVRLPVQAVNLGELVVKADAKNPAYAIMEEVIKNKNNRWSDNTYSFELYTKAVLEKERQVGVKDDSAGYRLVKDKTNYIETLSEVNFKSEKDIQEVIIAQVDHSEKQNATISFDFGFDGSNSQKMEKHNPYLYRKEYHEGVFDFGKNQLSVPSLCLLPISSPLSTFALAFYKFRLDEVFYEDSLQINKIEVIPRFSEDAAFSGYIYVVDKQWMVKSFDLEINPGALLFFDRLKIIQEHVFQDSLWVPLREEFTYSIKEGKTTMYGNTLNHYGGFYPLDVVQTKKNGKANILFKEDAFEKDSVFWLEKRPVLLSAIEQKFVRQMDSITSAESSLEYLLQQDSIYNRITFWEIPLTGIGFRNAIIGEEIHIDPLIAQMWWFGVGGYRHALGLSYLREVMKNKKIKLFIRPNYGFKNKDLKWESNIKFSYNAKKFASIKVGYANDYKMINNYESISATFSRSNFIAREVYLIEHDFEALNGLYLKSSLDYGWYHSISDLTLSNWSKELFGSKNTPIGFSSFHAMNFKLNISYHIGQEFVLKPNKKIILGQRFPTVFAEYKKGIPYAIKSELDYDFIELGIKHKLSLGKLGEGKYRFVAGSFFNTKNIRFNEYKFFRGSDPYFYSDPMRSFQLLGPAINTSDWYLHGSYIHHFMGGLLNKIPLVNLLGLQSVGGASVLLTQQNNRFHFETYAGLEKPFKIKNQLFKLGVYFVGADSNFSDIKGQIKFGINFYDSYSNTWMY